jgi:hypothetical protein
VTERKGVLVGVTAGKALVGHVEEGEVVARLDSVGDLDPLLLSWVNTGWVVGASMEQDNATLGHGLDIGNHALKVEANGVLVVVAVLLDLQAGVLEDGIVVGPRGSGDVDGLCAGVVTLEEGATNAERTRARDGLGDGDAVFVQWSRVGAVGELEGSLGEVGNTGDASILLVQVRLDDLLLGFLDGGKHVGLALVIAVRTNTYTGQLPCLDQEHMGLQTQVDFLRVAVGLECFGDTQNSLGGVAVSDYYSCLFHATLNTYILRNRLVSAYSIGAPMARGTYWRSLGYLRPDGDSSDAALERELLGGRLAQRGS